MTRKPLHFLGSSLDDLRAFPEEARRDAGFNLDFVQRGMEPLDWKPIQAVGPGVKEIRVRDAAGAFRGDLSGGETRRGLCPSLFPEKDPEDA